MKLSTVQTVTVTPAQDAVTVQSDTIVAQFRDTGSAWIADQITVSNSTAKTPISARTLRAQTLYDATTTPTYASFSTPPTNAANYTRLLAVLGLTA